MKMRIRWQMKGKKAGVTVFEGDSDAPSPWIYRIMFGLAGVETTLGVLTLFLESHSATFGFLFAACVHGGIGRWMYDMRKRMLSLIPQERMSEWLGVEPAQVEALIVERGVKPAYFVNGRPFYNRADFETGALLRASSAPDATEELLRPSHNTTEPAELLLRASSDRTEAEVITTTTPNEKETQYQQVS